MRGLQKNIHIKSRDDLASVLDKANIPPLFYDGLAFVVCSDYEPMLPRLFGLDDNHPGGEFDRTSHVVYLQDNSSTSRNCALDFGSMINEIGNNVYSNVLTREDRQKWDGYTRELERELFEIFGYCEAGENDPPFFGLTNPNDALLAEKLCEYTHIYAYRPGWFSESKERGLIPSEVFSQIFQDYFDPVKPIVMDGLKAHQNAYGIRLEGFQKLEGLLANYSGNKGAKVEMVFAGHGNFLVLYARNLIGLANITGSYVSD